MPKPEEKEALSAKPTRFMAWGFSHRETRKRRGKQPEVVLTVSLHHGISIEIAMPLNLADELGTVLNSSRLKRKRKELKM